MKKLPIAAAVAALGMSAQAFGYDAVANLEFAWTDNGNVQGWTASGPNSITTLTDSTYLTDDLSGANVTTYYNADFATPAYLTSVGCPPGFEAQYACKTASGTFPVSDVGPGGRAEGTLTITDTTMTGTLSVIPTNDEGVGPQPDDGLSPSTPLTEATGYNVRSADGSPFKNVWYGISDQMTLDVALTGTFTASQWDITGGTVKLNDPGFQCAVADFSGVLCSPGQLGDGEGSFLSWGYDSDGAGTITEIPLADELGNAIETISGVLASLAVSGDGGVGSTISTLQGELRRGSSQGACPGQVQWDGSAISCGTILATPLTITGTVVPVPAAVWLFGSALGLLGWVRRRTVA